MQIMDRTRGLGWTLGKVIGRTLGREVSGDADESPRRRRPTTSAHRQREVASFVEDVEHVDHVVDEVHKQLEKATAEDVDADAQDFPDRPHDTSILMDYIHHVAVTVWNREERPELKLSSHGRKEEKFGRPVSDIEGLVAATGLSPLIACSLDTSNRGLISAFAERSLSPWMIFKALHVDEVVDLLVDLLEFSSEEARDETLQCHEAHLRDIYRSKCDAALWTVAAQAYLLHLIGCTLFANKSATHVHMYWIYEHFPTVSFSIAVEDYHERKLCAYHWKSGKILSVSMYRK
ncbi:hypothetical protein GmHk_07G020283 [Glycine max]|nr:hypothetical protein GmHk_07G020283 [Glycine max]